MRSPWLIWSFIPGLHWLAWIQAAVLTKQPRYYWFGGVYALPLLLYLLRRASFPLLLLSWGLSLLHAHMLKRDIDRQMASRPSCKPCSTQRSSIGAVCR
jgi:hypothetical protein